MTATVRISIQAAPRAVRTQYFSVCEKSKEFPSEYFFRLVEDFQNGDTGHIRYDGH